MVGAEGGGPRQPPTLQPTDTPEEGWQAAPNAGTGSGRPLAPRSSIFPPGPPLGSVLPKVEDVLPLARSLLPPFVYKLSTTGGGRGHADAGSGGVALQLWKLPFHSHRHCLGEGALGGCRILAHQLAGSPVAPMSGQLLKGSPRLQPSCRAQDLEYPNLPL